MFVRQKKNKSGSTSVVVVRKEKGRYKLVKTIGSSSDPQEIESLCRQGKEWIRRQTGMADMFADAEGKSREMWEVERFFASIENVMVNGDSLIVERIFDSIGIAEMEDDVFKILSQPKVDGKMVEYDKGNGRKLLVGYTENRARKDVYNREKGVRKLEKAYRSGRLSKENINRRGYNKFLEMKSPVEVSINYEKIAGMSHGTD